MGHQCTDSQIEWVVSCAQLAGAPARLRRCKSQHDGSFRPTVREAWNTNPHNAEARFNTDNIQFQQARLMALPDWH